MVMSDECAHFSSPIIYVLYVQLLQVMMKEAQLPQMGQPYVHHQQNMVAVLAQRVGEVL